MMQVPYLYVAHSPERGRGVFTLRDIEPGEAIEVCPLISLPPQDIPLVHASGLHDYYFLWDDEADGCAIALGYGSLYNHSYAPNARYEMDKEHLTLDIFCLRPIKRGEEITINYNGEPDNQDPVWFELGEARKTGEAPGPEA